MRTEEVVGACGSAPRRARRCGYTAERVGALTIPVYVYSEFHAGQQADEPRA